MKTRIVLGLITLLGTAGLFAACGGDDDMGGMDHGRDEPSEAADADVNDADVAFAQGMIPHHEQAVEMAGLAEGRAEGPEVVDLAERIEAAQGPEIEQLRGWLEGWGEEMPGSMDHGRGSGMMGEDDMAALEAATGAEFDEMFLTMMIEHHEGAVEQAETELDEGRNDDARELAEAIIDAQQAEIEEMRELIDAA